jgi:hypothetical protein
MSKIQAGIALVAEQLVGKITVESRVGGASMMYSVRLTGNNYGVCDFP